MVNRTELSNGIRIISQQIPHSRSVTTGIWVVGGSREESPSSAGASHFIEHMLFKGTPRRSALDIARDIDSMGGFMNAFTGREFVCYYAKVLSDFFPGAFDLLADIFLNSSFPEAELESERKVILQEIKMLEDNPDDRLHEQFHRLIWKGHHLGAPIIGSEETVGGMTRETLLSYRNTNYLGGDVIISAAGDVNHQELVDLVTAVFASVPSGSGRKATAPPLYSKACGIEKREMEQLLFTLGCKGLSQNHPGRYDLLLLNTIFGGSMSSRLFQEVREKAGLAYSIYSSIESHSDTGIFLISAGTTVDMFDQVMEIVMRELVRLKNEIIPTDILGAAKAQLKGNILLSLESSDNIMSRLAKNEIYLGGYQPVEQVIAGFTAVTGESLLDLANEIIHSDHFTMQILGDTSKISFTSSSITV